MTFEHVAVESTDGVAVVTVTRPEVLNALNRATIDELDRCLETLSHDGGIRAVVLTGAGERAFIAGADVSELITLTPTDAHAVARRGQALCDRIARYTRPVIAAINGFALGGGCEVALACTIRLAADTARLGQPEVDLGLIPGFGGTQRLPRLVGSGRALELLLTGQPIEAREAWRIGLVNRVVPSSDLLEEAMSLGRKLASKPPRAIASILEAVRAGGQMPLDDACAFEAALFGLVTATEDMREGTQAFLAKRPAAFKGR